MTYSIINLLIDFLVVGLLMANISYCWVLNKRIKILQDGKSELANLLQHFDESTRRASESIVALQTASKKIGENIQTRIDKVNYLMDDLAFMVEKGNRLVDQLDANFAVNRARTRVLSEESAIENRNDVIREEKPVEKAIMNPGPVLEKPSIKEKTSASLEAVLDRVVGRSKAANQNANTGSVERNTGGRPKAVTAARSKAEQELLDMIRAGIKG